MKNFSDKRIETLSTNIINNIQKTFWLNVNLSTSVNSILIYTFYLFFIINYELY